ncbi:MAG: hypothetical protein WC852_04730 [Candidatus Nanoarchaeia archaeon]|jgi:predicted transcriptional regulator of viral defense system
MNKKNYISRGEAEIWQYISNKEIIDAMLIKDIFPDIAESRINKALSSLCRKGYIQRARRSLYYNPLLLKSPYSLALMLHEGYIGLSSALREYNLIEYEDFTIFVITKTFRKNIRLKGTKYEVIFLPLGKLFTGFEKKGNFYISSVEKTLFDCFLKPGHIGYSNITKAVYDAKINWDKFIGFFRLADNHSLCQRAGYILEMMKKETKIKVPAFVFEYLLQKVKNPVRLTSVKGKTLFSKKWKVQDNLGKENILSWWQ